MKTLLLKHAQTNQQQVESKQTTHLLKKGLHQLEWICTHCGDSIFKQTNHFMLNCSLLYCILLSLPHEVNVRNIHIGPITITIPYHITFTSSSFLASSLLLLATIVLKTTLKHQYHHTWLSPTSIAISSSTTTNH